MKLGVCRSIDRTNQVANVIPRGETLAIPMGYRPHRGRPPCWPLANVYYEQTGGIYRVVGAVGDRRVILHDDFLTVPAGKYGDTPWTLQDFGAGGAATQAPATAGVPGAVALTAAAADTVELRKDLGSVAVPASPSGLHVSARFSVSALPSTFGVECGLIDNNAAGGYAAVSIQATGAGASCDIITADAGGTNSTIVQATVPVASTYYFVDLILTSSFCSGWFGIDGPYTIKTHLPPGPLPPIPAYISNSGVAAPLTMSVDYYDLELVNPVADPNLLTAIKVSG